MSPFVVTIISKNNYDHQLSCPHIHTFIQDIWICLTEKAFAKIQVSYEFKMDIKSLDHQPAQGM